MRLSSDGTSDASFNLSSGADGTVYSIWTQADGKVLIGGAFNSVRGIPRSSVARLNGDMQSPLFRFQSAERSAEQSFQALVTGEIGRTYTIQASTNLISWTTLTNLTQTGANSLFVDFEAAAQPRRFYRAVLSP